MDAICPMGVSMSATYAQLIATKLFPEEAFMDDVLLRGKSFEAFRLNVEMKLQTARKYNLKLSAEKTVLNAENITYLGREVNAWKTWLSPDTIKAVTEFQHPTTVTELRQFLGLLKNYSREYIPDFARTALPLYDALKNSGKLPSAKHKKQLLTWSNEMLHSFSELKRLILESK